MVSSDSGHHALVAIDAALAQRPHKGGHQFSAATRCLSAYRDGLIGDLRAGRAVPDTRARLGRVNAVISIVLAGQFPLDKVPWTGIEAARSTLAEVLRTDDAALSTASQS